MIYDLIPPDDPRLHTEIKKCSYDLDRKSLALTLVENMMHYKGIGLSANQIGIEERAFCMYTDLETQATLTLFNPRIVHKSVREERIVEGCLSFPGEEIAVTRPYAIVVKYEDEEKKLHKAKFSGITARVFQHEYEHMIGQDFTQYKKESTYEPAYWQ
tara:strand:- start:1692 stop:2165 length:474 start_codon:yes stop_codon:yes gene_type:complete